MWCPLHIRCLWWSCYCACCTISWASSRLKEVSTNRFQQLGNKFDKDYGIRTHWHCFWFVFLFNTVWDGEWSNHGASSPGSTQRMSPLFWCLAQPESSLRNLRSGTCCKGNGKTPRFHSKFYGYVQMVHSLIGGGKGGGFEEGTLKEEGKKMRHESALLREWTWSPTYHLASGNTVWGPLFCYIYLKQLFHGSGDKAMYGVGIQGHVASSNYLKEIVCTLTVSTIVSLSFWTFPKSCDGRPAHIFIIMKRLMFGRNNPNPPCREELQCAAKVSSSGLHLRPCTILASPNIHNQLKRPFCIPSFLSL